MAQFLTFRVAVPTQAHRELGEQIMTKAVPREFRQITADIEVATQRHVPLMHDAVARVFQSSQSQPEPLHEGTVQGLLRSTTPLRSSVHYVYWDSSAATISQEVTKFYATKGSIFQRAFQDLQHSVTHRLGNQRLSPRSGRLAALPE